MDRNPLSVLLQVARASRTSCAAAAIESSGRTSARSAGAKMSLSKSDSDLSLHRPDREYDSRSDP